MRGRPALIVILIIGTLALVSMLFLGSPEAIIRDYLEKEQLAQLNEQLDGLRGKPVGDLFIGDSMTARFKPFMEETDSTVNLGMGGETTDGLAGRLDMICTMRPRRIFLMTGINDLLNGLPVADVFSNYKGILTRLRSDLPDAGLYVQGLMPVSPGVNVNSDKVNTRVRALNRLLSDECATRKLVFVDLYDELADASQGLRADLTTDGLHLNERGYMRWASVLARVCRGSERVFKPSFFNRVLSSEARLFLLSNGLVNDSLRRCCNSLWPSGMDQLRTAVVVNATHGDAKRTKKLRRVRSRFMNAGFDTSRMESFDLLESPPDSLLAYDAVYILGGNPFLLFRDFHDAGAKPSFWRFVIEGKIMMGYSAGAMLLGPGAWHMEAVDSLLGYNAYDERRLEGANLYPFLVFPHFDEFKREVPGLAEVLKRYEEGSAFPVYRINDGEGILYDRGRAWKVGPDGRQALMPILHP